MVQHSSLTGSECHEPKGADTASAGEIFVADGAGSGSWTENVEIEYGAINNQETDAVSVSSIGTTAQTLPFTNDGVSEGVVTDAANNRLTLTNAGVYWVNFNMSFSTVASGDSGDYIFKLLDDGVFTGCSVHREMSGGPDTGSTSFSFLVDAGAGSQMTVTVESDSGGNSDDIDINFANLIAARLS